MSKDDIRANASICAMQGILESGKIGELLELSPKLVAKLSVRMANSLVDELARNKTNEDLDTEIKDILKKRL